jgi:FKBP-type peptidyl-prolyl cis-trans isomerase SlyD
MKVAENSIVTMHYTLTDDDGQVLDSSAGKDPLKYLHGYGNIIIGLEREIEGCEAGTQKTVVVAPKDAYGEWDDELVQTLPREAFGGFDKIEVGMEFHATNADGQVQSVVVTAVEGDQITINANHEMAGKRLTFDISIEDVRPATKDELDHGHAH